MKVATAPASSLRPPRPTALGRAARSLSSERAARDGRDQRHLVAVRERRPFWAYSRLTAYSRPGGSSPRPSARQTSRDPRRRRARARASRPARGARRTASRSPSRCKRTIWAWRRARTTRDRLRHRDQACLHGRRRRRPRARAAGRVPVHARAVRDDVPRPAVDDPAVRGLRLGRGDERALPLPARPRPDGALDRVRPPDAARLRLGRSARRGRGRADRRRHRLDRGHAHRPLRACRSTASRRR